MYEREIIEIGGSGSIICWVGSTATSSDSGAAVLHPPPPSLIFLSLSNFLYFINNFSNFSFQFHFRLSLSVFILEKKIISFELFYFYFGDF